MKIFSASVSCVVRIPLNIYDQSIN